MNTPKPQYGFQLCTADDKERTHFLCTAHSHETWYEKEEAATQCPFVHAGWWQKPIPSPDGLPWERSEWELVKVGDVICRGDKYYTKRIGGSDFDWFDCDTTVGKEAGTEVRDHQPVSFCAFARRKQPARIQKSPDICVGCGLPSDKEPSVTRRGDDKFRCNDCARIQPGEGWRLLERGEVIQSHDEFWSESLNQWSKTFYPGSAVSGSPLTAYTYRRRIEPAAEQNQGQPKSGWVYFLERKPEQRDFPLFAAFRNGDGPKCNFIESPVAPTNWHKDYYAWRKAASCDSGPLPPEKSEAEAALEKARGADPWIHQGSFIAGYAAAKGGVK